LGGVMELDLVAKFRERKFRLKYER
jgi:hypothetical protein